MATLFKSYVTSAIGETYTTVTPAVGAGKTLTVLGVTVFNVSASTVNIKVKLVKSGGVAPHAEAHMAYNLALPAGTGFEFNDGNKHILQEGDVLQVRGDLGVNLLEVIVNYMEIS